MLVLGIDTCFYYLTLSLMQDDKQIAKCYVKCHKNQSEIIFTELTKLFNTTNKTTDELDAVVITVGPGSYTGVRIAMSIAKVYCTQANIPLYTIPTLLLYAGLENKLVVMDARASRCYVALYYQGTLEMDPAIMAVADVEQLVAHFPHYQFYGDGHLIGIDDNFSDVSGSFLLLKSHWQLIKQPHTLVPDYWKDMDSYG